jgi:hypothetical protein
VFDNAVHGCVALSPAWPRGLALERETWTWRGRKSPTRRKKTGCSIAQGLLEGKGRDVPIAPNPPVLFDAGVSAVDSTWEWGPPCG